MTDILEPDFDSVVVERRALPGSDAEKIITSFEDPALSGYSVVVLKDTVPYDTNYASSDGLDTGDRALTLITRFPRCVLSEVNTHRVFSRNSASSRARSFKTTISEIMEDPYIPLFTKNQRGMSGDYLSAEERERAVSEWLKARDSAVVSVLRMLLEGVNDDSVASDLEALTYENVGSRWKALADSYSELYQAKNADMLSPHKQNVNRLLEPFMWHEAIISSTYWENFFDLRDHSAAQPEIRAIARLARVAVDASVPAESLFHVPFKDENVNLDDIEDVPDEQWSELRKLFMDSAGDCARVSYKSKLETGSKESTNLGERLLVDGHLSPFEHVAIDREYILQFAEYFNTSEDRLPKSNFSDRWIQFRALLESGFLK